MYILFHMEQKGKKRKFSFAQHVLGNIRCNCLLFNWIVTSIIFFFLVVHMNLLNFLYLLTMEWQFHRKHIVVNRKETHQFYWKIDGINFIKFFWYWWFSYSIMWTIICSNSRFTGVMAEFIFHLFISWKYEFSVDRFECFLLFIIFLFLFWKSN